MSHLIDHSIIPILLDGVIFLDMFSIKSLHDANFIHKFFDLI